MVIRLSLGAWSLFLLTWLAAAAWTARAVKHTSFASTARDGVVYLICFGLLFIPRDRVGGWWDTPNAIADLLLLLELTSFGFAWWARVHLGALWSGRITLRAGHRIVQSGPYRFVRHPIYTGFLGAAWAFALLVATPTALLGAALLSAEMGWKAVREEQFLRAELGQEAYQDYARRTPMLIPFARGRRG